MNPAIKQTSRNLEANIVILGSGGGAAAALAAAEEGTIGIIILEKQDIPGGNSRLAGGLFACESPVQKRQNIIADKDQYFRIAMNWAHCARVDPRIVRAYLNKSGDTISWLEKKGLKFETPTSVNSNQPHMPHMHQPVGRGSRLMEIIVKGGEDLGVKTLLNTSGKRILREQNGNVTGVIAIKEGEEIEIKARSVIIATGGFPSNVALLKKYCPDYYDGMQLGNWPHHTGDGLLMAAEVGAAIADSIPISHQGPNPESSTSRRLLNTVRNPCTIWVNKRGRRFIDEGGYMTWENGNAILLQPNRVMYCLFDDEIRQKMEGKEPTGGHGKLDQRTIPSTLEEELQKLAQSEHGGVKMSDSWDEIARRIGADPRLLKTTIDEYNSYCAQRYDEVFDKDHKHLLPLLKAPYYAIQCGTTCGETLGGIKVNEHMEVLDTQDNIIPGLYAAGVIADGWEPQTYNCNMGGTAFGFAINSGRIAGENAARFVRTTKNTHG